MTFCDTLAEIEVSFWADGTETGWTDGRGSRNSYLDIFSSWKSSIFVLADVLCGKNFSMCQQSILSLMFRLGKPINQLDSFQRFKQPRIGFKVNFLLDL